MYIDIGANSGDTAQLAFAFTGTNTARTWDIKVTQIECGNPSAYVSLHIQTKNNNHHQSVMEAYF